MNRLRWYHPWSQWAAMGCCFWLGFTDSPSAAVWLLVWIIVALAELLWRAEA